MRSYRYLALLLLVMPFTTAAQDAGRMLLAVGEVVLERGNGESPIAANDLVRVGDVVRTGAASAAQMRFDDGSVVAMRAKSRFRIAAFRFTGADDGVSQAAFQLLKGGIRTITGIVGGSRPERYEMRTPLATVGIRGTGYALVHCEQDCEDDEAAAVPDGTYGFVHEGRVAVANAAGEVVFGRDEAFFVADARTLPQPLVGRPGFLRDRLEARNRREERREQLAEARAQGTAAETRESVARAAVAALEARTGVDARPVAVLGSLASPIIAVSDQRDASGNIALLGPGLGAGVSFSTEQLPVSIVDGGAGTVVSLDADRGTLERFSFNGGAQSGERRSARVADGGRIDGDGGAVWGRWTEGGAVQVGSSSGAPATGVHFFFGSLTPESVFSSVPAAATALRYDYAGGPRPTDGNGNEGRFLEGTFVVNLVNRTLGGAVGYEIGEIRYVLPVPAGTPMLAGRGFVGFNAAGRDAGSWTCACSGASGTLDTYSVSGLFLGSRAQGLGVTFASQDSFAGRTAGAAIFRCVSGGCR